MFFRETFLFNHFNVIGVKMSDITQMYEDLFSNPKQTLRRNYITCTAGAVGAHKWNIVDREFALPVKGFTTKFSGLRKKTKDRNLCRFNQGVAATGRPDLENGELESYSFNAVDDVNGGVVPVDDVTHIDIPRQPDRNQPKIVWTSELSGCHIGVQKRTQTTLRLCHLKPMSITAADNVYLDSSLSARHNHATRTLSQIKRGGPDWYIRISPKIDSQEQRLSLENGYFYFIGIYIGREWNFYGYNYDRERGITKVTKINSGTYKY